MLVGVVVAGGSGRRVGFKKQYITLLGKPMWMRSVEVLLDAGAERVCLVVPKEDLMDVHEFIRNASLESVVDLVAGGGERSESVKNGVRKLSEALTDEVQGNLVVIHDAARPFVLTSDVERTVAAAELSGGALLGKPCVDTMKEVIADGSVVGTVDRTKLWHAQTPQVFRIDWLLEAYERLGDGQDGFSRYTDEASMLEGFGYPVKIVKAEGYNAKVTTKEDVEFAEWWARKRWGEPE